MLGDHTYTGLLQASNSEKKKELDLGDKFICAHWLQLKSLHQRKKIYSLQIKSSLSYSNTSQSNANTIFNIKRKHV